MGRGVALGRRPQPELAALPRALPADVWQQDPQALLAALQQPEQPGAAGVRGGARPRGGEAAERARGGAAPSRRPEGGGGGLAL